MGKQKKKEQIIFGNSLFILWHKYMGSPDTLEDAIAEEFIDVSREIYSDVSGLPAGSCEGIRKSRTRSLIDNIYDKICEMLR
ncbi:MAG: hypothetical protein GY853_05840 [PVC group bacterium]|nr:hypothetical protein [PVC group bacterium]